MSLPTGRKGEEQWGREKLGEGRDGREGELSVCSRDVEEEEEEEFDHCKEEEGARGDSPITPNP
jgi:hypothetical protein